MTRKDYIGHLDALRKGVLKIIDFDRNERQNNGGLAGPTSHEDERGKKTQKMFDDLVTRLYEDAAISEKIMQEKILAGDLEQAEMTFTAEMAEKAAEDMEKRAKRKGGAK